MNFGRENFINNENSVYVVVEILPNIISTEHTVKIVGVYRSHENASSASLKGSNRYVKGPLIIFDDFVKPIFPKIQTNPSVFPNLMPPSFHQCNTPKNFNNDLMEM